MSDYLALGGVSAVLNALLTAGVAAGGPSTVLTSPPLITNKAPDMIASGPEELPQLNLFLYQASVNTAIRNVGLPSRNAAGGDLSNPPLALDLHYLVTAYGSSPYDPEILLAFAMQIFHRTPVISRAVIQDALSALAGGTPSAGETLIAASTLASQMESLRITPEVMTTEDLHRLWRAFQTHYRPSAAYQVSVVIIQDTKSFTSNLPVQRRSLAVLPLISPVLEAVSPAMVPTGGLLTITGSNLLGDTAAGTQVSFNGAAPIAAANVQGNLVQVAVPTTVQAGVCSVRILRSVTFPSSTRAHPGFSSNPIPFQLIPTIQSPAAPLPPLQVQQQQLLTLTLTPAVAQLQSVVVYIGDQAMPVTHGPLTGPATSNTVAITLPASIVPGTYPLRVEVDGAQSKLSQDADTASPTFGQWLPLLQVNA